MFDTIGMSLNKYFDFKGRATRKEFWSFYLFTWVATFAAGLVEGIAGINGLSSLVMVAGIIPSLSCGVRRMHDVGKSGWFVIVPIANFVFLVSATVPEVTENQSGTITSS